MDAAAEAARAKGRRGRRRGGEARRPPTRAATTRADRRRAPPADLLVVAPANPARVRAQPSERGRRGGRRCWPSATAAPARGKEHALADEVRVAGKRLALAIPTTYMNESGQAVALARRYGVEDDLHALVVVHDESTCRSGA